MHQGSPRAAESSAVTSLASVAPFCAPADAVVVTVKPAAAVSAPTSFHSFLLRPTPDHCRSAVTVSKRENCLGLGSSPIRRSLKNLRRRLRSLVIIEMPDI
jgi:hypothetical protein